MPKPWNETVYFVMGSYKSYGGFYGWGNTILEAFQNASKNGGSSADQYYLLKIVGDFSVSHFDGSISHQKDALTKLTEIRKWPRSIKREAEKLEAELSAHAGEAVA
jgi:hypothetical protein